MAPQRISSTSLSQSTVARMSQAGIADFFMSFFYYNARTSGQSGKRTDHLLGMQMAEIVKLDDVRRSRKARKPKSKSGLKPRKLGKGRKGVKWSSFKTGTLTTPLVAEMMRMQTAAPPTHGRLTLLESGVLAFRREENGNPLILLISRKRSKKWGIPKGKVIPTLTFPENAAKEAFEEAGVIGYISPSSVGMFRAKKRAANSQTQQIIEVWIYMLEVTETVADWPERGKRAIRWVTCEAAARHLREPVLAHLCHRLAQG